SLVRSRRSRISRCHVRKSRRRDGGGRPSRDLSHVWQPRSAAAARDDADAANEPQPAYPLTLVMCGACGLAQLPDVVDPELLYRDYIYKTSISLGLVQHFDNYAEAVIQRVGAQPGSLMIDIGSND